MGVVFKSSELAKQLGMSERTLRRWCETIEEKGIVFARDASGRREFDESHLHMLQQIKKSLAELGTLDQAIKASLSSEHTNDHESNLKPINPSIKHVKGALETLVSTVQAGQQKESTISHEDYDKKCEQLRGLWMQMDQLIQGDWMRIILFQNNPQTAIRVIEEKWLDLRKQMENII